MNGPAPVLVFGKNPLWSLASDYGATEFTYNLLVYSITQSQ